MRLECGGGLCPAPGHINIDIIPEADIQWDLNKGLPNTYPIKPFINTMGDKVNMLIFDQIKNTIEGIRCHQVIEHLDTIIPLMNDCYQVMKEGALFEISTPLAGTTQFWQDPTHKKGYVPESFYYFIKDSPYKKEQDEYGITARFIIEKLEVLDGWNLNVTLKK